MHQSPIQKLLDLGDEMLISLESGDFERFSDLLERRGQAVRSIAAELNEGVLSESDEESLSSQGTRLEEAMRSTRTALGAAVSAVSRFQTARKTYRTRPGKSDGRLNKSLHG